MTAGSGVIEVELPAGRFRIRGAVIVDARSKTGHARTVPLPPEAARIARRRLPFSIGIALLTKRFNAARTAAGMPMVRFHDLRHAFGT
ncbi:MAG: hypothetical protein AB1761_17005 [Pseudomonadota bacterium]